MTFQLLAWLVILGSLAVAQAKPTCTRSEECQQLALESAAREEFETFHELAWRAVQTGKKNDPELMFLLARAQSLSGRPDDALVMLTRLADRGIFHPEAETLADFNRMRDMAGWPKLLERMRVAASTIPPVSSPAEVPSTPSSPPPTPPAPVAPAPRSASASTRSIASAPEERKEISPTVVPVDGIIAVPTTVGTPVGMAYDRVSARMIVADDSSATLKVISESSGNAVDLVSRGWGGGYHTNALVIDSKRGDLWVVGGRTADAPHSIVHRLQLISGRLLYSVPPPEDAGETQFTAVALSSASVFVLDAEGGRIFELAPAGKTLRLRSTLPIHNLTGLTLANDAVAYVSHAGGILRVDLATKRSESVKSSPGIALDGIEWIGYFENSLLAVQRANDGAMAAVRLRFDRSGHTVTAVDAFGAAAAKSATLLGDTFFFVSPSPEGTSVARVKLRK